MTTPIEKRANKRYPYNTPIVFSGFNTKDSYDAQTFNYCMDGMGLKSTLPLRCGKTICIRVTHFKPGIARSGEFDGLRSITLAEVKWCREITRPNDFSYEVGVKYCTPVY